jgi:hypothetical protein
MIFSPSYLMIASVDGVGRKSCDHHGPVLHPSRLAEQSNQRITVIYDRVIWNDDHIIR